VRVLVCLNIVWKQAWEPFLADLEHYFDALAVEVEAGGNGWGTRLADCSSNYRSYAEHLENQHNRNYAWLVAEGDCHNCYIADHGDNHDRLALLSHMVQSQGRSMYAEAVGRLILRWNSSKVRLLYHFEVHQSLHLHSTCHDYPPVLEAHKDHQT